MTGKQTRRGKTGGQQAGEPGAIVRHAAVKAARLFKLPDDPAAPNYALGDLGPLRGPRRRKPTTYGKPSTFGLSPEALLSERRHRAAEGWREWELAARFADPSAELPCGECAGEFGPAGTWHASCQECAA